MSGRVFRRGKTWSYVVDLQGGRANRRQQTKGGFCERSPERDVRDQRKLTSVGSSLVRLRGGGGGQAGVFS
jgi:hypothetical protein